MTKIHLAAIAALAIATAWTPAAAAQGQRDPMQLLDRADTNGDGRITRAEFTDSRARMFEKLDRNDDGYFSDADMSQRRFKRRSGGGGRLKELIVHLDENGDGRVARSEFVEGPNPMFDRADLDRNDVIDADEMAKLREAVAARRAD
ncbi:MAG TPA: hypothetical protein VEZ59_06210 [Sphingopyxis sp.]|nr:hypothetical protein [Sphingopyxis sp.]